MPIATLQKNQPPSQKQRPVYIREAVSSVQGFKNFVKYKFSPDQWYGTLVLVAAIYKSTQQLKTSWYRNVVTEGGKQDNLKDNEQEINKPLVTANSMALATQIWALFSSRSAIPPSGNSYKERISDTVRHPERSHEQAKYLAQTLTNCIYFWMAIQHGFTSKGQKEERWPRRLTAITMPVIVSLSFKDLLGPRNRQASTDTQKTSQLTRQTSILFRQSESRSIGGKLLYPFRVIHASWKENPRRMVSLGLGICMSLFWLAEGIIKRKTMLNRLHLASTEGAPEWHDMRTKLISQKDGWAALAEEGALPDAMVTKAIVKMRKKKLVESSGIIQSGVISLTTALTGVFYSLDQLHKGEQMLKQQQQNLSLPPARFR